MTPKQFTLLVWAALSLSFYSAKFLFGQISNVIMNIIALGPQVKFTEYHITLIIFPSFIFEENLKF